MRTVLAPRKADDVTFVQHMLAFGRAQRRLAAEHDHPFLVQVVRVEGQSPLPGSTSDMVAPMNSPPTLADKRALDAPALAVPRPVPFVAVEVESLHSVDDRPRHARMLSLHRRRLETEEPCTA